MSDKPNTIAEKLDVKKTVLIGFGFMATTIAWGIYDSYVPPLLERLLKDNPTIAHWSADLASKPGMDFLTRFMETQEEGGLSAAGAFTIIPLLIGIIMTFDNIFGVIFQPLFGKFSDRTRSKWGKRRPFIFWGAPISAALFLLIPLVSQTSIPIMMTVIILFVFVMSLWRSPVVALMPDLTPPKLRSEGNAIINLCGGVGTLIPMLAASVFVALFGLNKDNEKLQEAPHVFALAAVVMIISTLVLRFTVHEESSNRLPAKTGGAKREETKKDALNLKALPKDARRSLIFMLVTLFLLFSGTNAIQTFFTLFAKEVLDKEPNEAMLLMAVFGGSLMVAAIPGGKCGKKYGRKKTILGGMAAFMVVFALYIVTRGTVIDNIAIMGVPIIFWLALIVGGGANMFITVNTLPLVLEIGGLDKVGTFTGYYYTATFSAQIASPILYGFVAMITGTYMSLFWYCPIMFALALLSIFFVRHGEADQDKLEEMVEQIELENAD